MRVTIDIPDSVVQHANALGVSVSAFVGDVLANFSNEPLPSGFVRLGTSPMTREEATAALLEIQRSHTLGNISIRRLIEEGRRV